MIYFMFQQSYYQEVVADIKQSMYYTVLTNDATD